MPFLLNCSRFLWVSDGKCASAQDLRHEWVDVIRLDIQGMEWDVLQSWLTAYRTVPLPFSQLSVRPPFLAFPCFTCTSSKISVLWERRLNPYRVAIRQVSLEVGERYKSLRMQYFHAPLVATSLAPLHLSMLTHRASSSDLAGYAFLISHQMTNEHHFGRAIMPAGRASIAVGIRDLGGRQAAGDRISGAVVATGAPSMVHSA